MLSFLLLCAVPIDQGADKGVDKGVDTGTISSSNASYDGNALILKGQVILDHGLGKMQAEEAILQKQETGKDFPFSVIHLEKDVILKLAQNAELKCEKADLDFSTLKGALTSSQRVTYTDSLKKKKGKPASLQLQSQNIDLQFMKKSEPNSTKAHYDVESVVARDNVELAYADGYTLFTDAVLYQKKTESNELLGHLSSYGKQRCKLVHQADTVEAERFDLDTVHNRLVLTHPQGILPSLSKGELRFTAETLVWEHDKNTMVLKGNPVVEDPNLGTLNSNHEIYLFQQGKQLAGFKTFGKTTLHYLNSHELVSNGTISFDRERHVGTVESPLVDGVVPEGQQLSYQEGEMSVLADKAHIEYSENEGAFTPVSLSLKGHIKISSRSDDKPARFGIADRLTYSPSTRTFILGADQGKKVVFVNNEENLRISAQEVHITQDPVTKKQSVKGLGNVQLALSAEEEAALNKYFGHLHAPTAPKS
jgi:lipopolysaccharide export system protein LptA